MKLAFLLDKANSTFQKKMFYFYQQQGRGLARNLRYSYLATSEVFDHLSLSWSWE